MYRYNKLAHGLEGFLVYTENIAYCKHLAVTSFCKHYYRFNSLENTVNHGYLKRIKIPLILHSDIDNKMKNKMIL